MYSEILENYFIRNFTVVFYSFNRFDDVRKANMDLVSAFRLVGGGGRGARERTYQRRTQTRGPGDEQQAIKGARRFVWDHLGVKRAVKDGPRRKRKPQGQRNQGEYAIIRIEKPLSIKRKSQNLFQLLISIKFKRITWQIFGRFCRWSRKEKPDSCFYSWSGRTSF